MLKNIILIILLLYTEYAITIKEPIKTFTNEPTIKEIVEQYAEAYGTEPYFYSNAIYNDKNQNRVIVYLKNGSTITIVKNSKNEISLSDTYTNEKMTFKKGKR